MSGLHCGRSPRSRDRQGAGSAVGVPGAATVRERERLGRDGDRSLTLAARLGSRFVRPYAIQTLGALATVKAPTLSTAPPYCWAVLKARVLLVTAIVPPK